MHMSVQDFPNLHVLVSAGERRERLDARGAYRPAGETRVLYAARGVMLLGVLMLVSANGIAQDIGHLAAGSVRAPGFHAGRPPAGLIAPPWGCAPGMLNCISREELRIILDRQRRFDNLRQDAPASGTGYPPQVRQLPPPTPDSEVQPAYRDSGTIRPEFRDSGTPLVPR